MKPDAYSLRDDDGRRIAEGTGCEDCDTGILVFDDPDYRCVECELTALWPAVVPEIA